MDEIALLSEAEQRNPKVFGRFWSKVDKTPTCWLWIGQLNHSSTQNRTRNYGIFYNGKRMILPHRWVYMEVFGVLDSTVHVHHKCGVSTCVRLAHLEALPADEHMRLHGNSDFCANGHPRTEQNGYWHTHVRGTSGKLYYNCRPCKREWIAAYRKTQREQCQTN